MTRDRRYFVYIMASTSGVLYTGCTCDLLRRAYQHRHNLIPGFTAEYLVNRLVYFEDTPNSRAAVQRERQIKGWSRAKKVRLIESVNLDWRDLAADWFPVLPEQDPSLRSG